MINSRKAIFAILNTYSPPNIWLLCSETQFCAEQVPHSLRPLGQDLISMPTGLDHHFSHSNDIIIGHITVKKVAHRINKYHLRSLPVNWLGKLFRYKAQIKALFIRMTFNSTKTFGKCFGITASASRADLGASANRVPGSVCPLDLRVVAHFSVSIGLRGARNPQF